MIHHHRKIGPLPGAGLNIQVAASDFAASFCRQIELSDVPELAVIPEVRDKINGNSCSRASFASCVPIVPA
jgi:hypothetical protein